MRGPKLFNIVALLRHKYIWSLILELTQPLQF